MPPLRATNLLETIEGARLHSSECSRWQRWGPYLSERQWGTVREDYSANGTAWDYFPHDHARSRAYRWGEDGIAGFGDDKLNWCVSLALWNGRDPILKERLFGLTNEQGNHGEDVKELYFYVDGTPTHSYMRMLYKYPQCAYPYADLIDENARRGPDFPEYEVLDTGAFDDNRYFDVQVEYAKHTAEDIVMRVTVENRADQPATLDVLPLIWARNTWSWKPGTKKPSLTMPASPGDPHVIARHDGHEPLVVTASAGGAQVEWLFCENETNVKRMFNMDGPGPFKDGFNDYIVEGDAKAVSRTSGTRAAAHVHLELEAQRPRGRRDALAAGIGAGRRAARHRRAVRAPHRGGRCVLRGAAMRHRRPGRAARAAAGARGHAVVEAVLPVRRHALDGRRPRPAEAAARPPPGAQCRLAASVQRGHRVDAGQMGVPVVRIVGPGVPCSGVRADRSRVRQAPVAAAGEGPLPASERPVAGLRVGIRRRQSARARVGHLARLRNRPRDHRQGRP